MATRETERAVARTKPPLALPILLSGFICPGLGQFFQRRTLAGTVFLSLSALGIAWFIAEIIPILQTMHDVAFAKPGESLGDPQSYSIARVGAALGFVLVVWLVNLFDVFFAATRARLVDNERALLDTLADGESRAE